MNRQLVVPDPQHPLVGVRVVYPKTVSKGEAWNHLWENLPELRHEGRSYVPFFEPLEGTYQNGKERRRNPYRKNHDDFAWAWTVSRWVEGRARKKQPKGPKKQPRSRYELLTDDAWLDGGVDDLA